MCIYRIHRTDSHTVTLYWRGVPIVQNIPDKLTANITERLLKQLIDGYERDEERQRQELRESYQWIEEENVEAHIHPHESLSLGDGGSVPRT